MTRYTIEDGGVSEEWRGWIEVYDREDDVDVFCFIPYRNDDEGDRQEALKRAEKIVTALEAYDAREGDR